MTVKGTAVAQRSWPLVLLQTHCQNTMQTIIFSMHLYMISTMLKGLCTINGNALNT